MIPSSGDRWPLEPDEEELRKLLDDCVDFAVEHIRTLHLQPSFDVSGANALAATFREPIPESGEPLESILRRLGPAFAKSFTTAGPGYLAYIPGGGIPAAAAADLLACATNRFVGVSVAAPALAQIEATVVEWLTSLMGCPPGWGGILTSGGSIANLTAIVAARAARLPEEFLSGIIYMTGETHSSLVKSARIAGFSDRNLRWIPVDSRLRMRPEALESAVRQDKEKGLNPFLVIANAGTTNTGAVDPILDLVEIGRRQDLWVHADAAYGGVFRITREGEKLLPGISQCDSITLDPHKGLFLPYGTGSLLLKEPAWLAKALRVEAHYLPDPSAAEGIPNYTEITPELSRDFRGLRVWLPLKLHGLKAFREQLEEKLSLARWAFEQLKEDPHFEMLDEPQLSLVAFKARANGKDPDALGQEILRRVNERRRVFLSGTRIGGRYVLRICVLSFRSHRDRVAEAVSALKEEARALAGGG
ncbi:MAG TPA: aminotransferase class V-fold PLP-dependent enzyme [Candidatus Polarisedimenticolia bacterium]|jgi:aromatic-L-amino-acid decarboxylase|nr:aminotransferase class V-fold PLP-dependent enzyme [Candidatus Polarisedimenticolia bacterium]